MKRIFFLLLFTLIFFSTNSCEKNNNPETDGADGKGHPRILLLEGEEQQIKDLIAADETWKKMHNAILEECNKILSKPELERVMVGRRLLSTSRELLRRVFFLAYGHRMTGDSRFLNKAEKEMLAVSRFSDWNPSHFLDVAEMTMGVAIGYDWLFASLTETSRKEIKNAILDKGINPSKDSKNNSWLKSSNNWNQVCNAGMTFGALAIQEDEPTLAKEIIERAFASLPISMEAYQPDGVYPEGYGYWGYGSSFNILFLSAVEKALGDDRGLSQTPGFLKTGQFMNNTITPTEKSFNWADCGTGTNLNPAMFWFAEKTSNPSVLWSEAKFLKTDDFSKFKGIRELPAIMIWAINIPLSKITEPAEKIWAGQGANPVSMMRTSWTSPDAVYLGFKAGSPSVNHGHMDIGSFVMEADGVRWASDPGMQDYESLESKGMSIFGKTQDAQRWTIFRMNNHSHNVLTFDTQLQQVSGYSKIDKSSGKEGFKFAISDISSVYNNQVKKAVRGVAIQDEKYVVVRDEIETTGKTTKVKWAMFTFANAELAEKSATLTIGTKKLYLKVNAPSGTTMKTWSTAPTNNYDATNPGTIMVGFECEVPANSKAVFEVLLVPEKVKDTAQFINKKLEDWN
jgi:hypothetical protein